MGIMGYTVSEEVLKRTDCRNGFDCLSGNMEHVCEVLNRDWTKVVLTNCSGRDVTCHYCKPFDGPQGLCICPTRIELLKRYGI